MTQTSGTKIVELTEDQIVVDRQALLTIVRSLDINAGSWSDIATAMDKLREPFFEDEMSSGKARRDFTMNKYDLPEPQPNVRTRKQ